MRRRAFIMTFGLAAVWPLAARTQKAIPVVGMLNSGPSEPRRDQLEGFHRGLKEAGFVVGQDVSILHLGADDRYDRLPALAAELVRRRVAVIAAVGGPVSALAAKAATSTNSNCLRRRLGSGQERARCELQSSGWQRHR